MSSELIEFLASLNLHQIQLMRDWVENDYDVPPDGTLDLLEAMYKELTKPVDPFVLPSAGGSHEQAD